jgi:hypothetical protein
VVVVFGCKHFFLLSVSANSPPQPTNQPNQSLNKHLTNSSYINKQASQYDMPIYITETGIADRSDANRAYMIDTYVQATLRAIRDGADVRGLYYWTLVVRFLGPFCVPSVCPPPLCLLPPAAVCRVPPLT